ncbi:HEPN domain-containing protein [candidate division KSB1 bacterium]|nr:HEPN domain-containing protein [candidate division KSB1 bacterium]
MVAEYCLKAYLVLNKKKIKKIHDLGKILDSCIAVYQDQEFETLREDCRILTRFKIDFAYPDHSPEVISVEEARAAIEKARAIYAFMLRKAQELGYSQS